MSELNPEILKAIEDQVSRFILQDIQPVVALHEVIAQPSQLETIRLNAVAMGVLASSHLQPDDYMGMTIWEAPQDPLSRTLSTHTLTNLAQKNAAIAYQFHQYSLAQWLYKKVGFSHDNKDQLDAMALSMQGHYGLGRYSLANYLQGQATQDDLLILDDYFSAKADNPCFVHGPHWQTLLAPVLIEDVLQWQLLSVDHVNCQQLNNSHGFDELSSWQWSRKFKQPTALAQSTLSKADSQKIFSELYAMNTLGLMSIAQGSAQHALNMSREYCDIRVQGGKKIANHPAVQMLISQVNHFVHMSHTQIESACVQINFTNLSLLSLMRGKLHVDACAATNDALQCFGGLGYMQDNGIEKIVRDNNQLRILNGTPIELTLFASAWESSL